MTQGRFMEKSFKKSPTGKEFSGKTQIFPKVRNMPSVPRKIVNPRGQRKGK